MPRDLQSEVFIEGNIAQAKEEDERRMMTDLSCLTSVFARNCGIIMACDDRDVRLKAMVCRVASNVDAGGSGVGKSAVMQHMLQQQSQTGAILPTTLTLSAQTTSIATQERIEARLERRHRNRQEFHADVSVLGSTCMCNTACHASSCTVLLTRACSSQA